MAGSAGDASGAGVGGVSGGAAGIDNPGGGSGGICCEVTGGAGGTGGLAGMSAPTGGASAGMGGAGGFGAGVGGTQVDPDGGTDEPGAPAMECEVSREVLQLEEVIGAFPLTCSMEAPDGTLVADGTFSLAVTPAQDGVEGETMWSEHKASADECGADQAFYVDNTLGIARLVLCPALCESLTMLSEDAAQGQGTTVTVEVIYGCDPPK